MMDSPLNRVSAIEGVRGVLSVIVVVGHVNANLALWFWGCMEIFFAISGFLIGSIALRYRHALGFWCTYLARRALRIWPLYFVVLAFCVGTDLVRGEILSDGSVDIGRGALQDLFFVQNAEMYGQRFPDPQLHGGGYPSMFHHSWSVAIEEQFYLFAPWLAWGLAALLRRIGPSRLRIAGAVLLFLCACVAVRASGISWWILLGRLDAFVLGVLVACLLERREPGLSMATQRLIRRGFVMIAAVTAVFALTYYLPQLYVYSTRSQYEWRHYLGVVVFALFGSALVVVCVTDSLPRLLAPLNWKIFQLLGKIRYSTYLWHVPVLLLVKDLDWYHRGVPMGLHLPVLLILVFAVSVVSFHLIESPPLRHKPRFRLAQGLPL